MFGWRVYCGGEVGLVVLCLGVCCVDFVVCGVLIEWVVIGVCDDGFCYFF